MCLIYILNFIKKALNAPMTPRDKLIMFSIACKWITTRLALPPPQSYGELTVVFRTLIGELVAPPSPADQPDGGETSIQDPATAVATGSTPAGTANAPTAASGSA